MSESLRFPRRRFASAGASKDEVAQLEREFERSDLGMKTDMVEHYRLQSSGSLREYLGNLREMGHFTDSPQRPLEAPVSEDDSESNEETQSADDDEDGGELDEDEPFSLKD